MGKQVRVTFKSTYKIKENRKWVVKTSQWEEIVPDQQSAKLRAMALNLIIVKMEPA